MIDASDPQNPARPDLDDSQGQLDAPGLSAFSLLRDVEVELTLEIGRRRMRIAEVLALGPGHTFELSKAVGEPLDLFVNGQLLGRGEAVVVGERYGVRITELKGPVPGGAR